MTGRRPSSGANPPAKRTRKVITLETKLEVLKRYARGEKTATIKHQMSLSESTLRTIRDNADKIKQSAKDGQALNATKSAYIRTPIMERMERMLSTWITTQNANKVPISMHIIQAKARAIHESLAEEEDDAKPFTASTGWFANFRNRHAFHKIRLCGEVASADKDAADRYKGEFKKIIQDGGYSKHRIFNADETGLYIKKMMRSTFIAQTEKTAPGYKASKTRVTLLFGANLAGDCKLKPLLIHQYENPRALVGLEKSYLPVRFYYQKSAWMDKPIFRQWVTKDVETELKLYCATINEPFKILLVLDNFSGHDPTLCDISENIKIVFMPPNTTALIQPMDQNVIATFKAKYLKTTLHAMLHHIETTEQSIKQFWERYNIRDAITNIASTWSEISAATLQAAWRNLCPHLATDFRGFDASNEVSRVRLDILNEARQIGFKDVNEDEVAELLDHTDELSVDDLRLLETQQQEAESAEAAAEAEDARTTTTTQLTSKNLAELLQRMESMLEFANKIDPNWQRSSKVARNVRDALRCYEEMLLEKRKHAKQPSIATFFGRTATPRITTPSPLEPQAGPSSRPDNGPLIQLDAWPSRNSSRSSSPIPVYTLSPVSSASSSAPSSPLPDFNAMDSSNEADPDDPQAIH